jgi:hypothetical protein
VIAERDVRRDRIEVCLLVAVAELVEPAPELGGVGRVCADELVRAERLLDETADSGRR